MGLNTTFTKHQHRQSDDLLALGCVSQCHDQPSPKATKGNDYTLRLDQIKTNNSDDNIDGDGPWSNNTIDVANSLSSSSSVYSASEEPNNSTECTVKIATDSETSARSSSIVSRNQESVRSIASSVGVTSVSSHYSQKCNQEEEQQKQKRKSDELKHTLSFSSLRKIKSLEKIPFKMESALMAFRWLCRKSDELIQRGDIETDDHQIQKLQEITPDLGAIIVQRMERLEEKIDILFSTTSKSTRSTIDESSSTYQSILDPDADTPVEQPLYKTYNQTPLQAQKKEHTETIQQTEFKILTAEINHLIKSNNNLSSCIDALGSSGLIDLLEMLSCSLERLHSAINSLRERQQQQQNLDSINNEEGDNQLRLQIDIIQSLGFLLGQREEQLRHERKLNQSYRENIEGLEGMISALEVEWKKVSPFISNSECMTDCIGRLKRGTIVRT
ncbi:hypothetical protein TSTA_020050 [Talaromyces stipitatus ATCC 10500]|uniref:Uncharacterized protein n=1 Tax=Talaromyces stipitatus (strain ATCC 10500 / CBS 375.48 / QM 6759 / NRRL 1006) TaxID=441959 RepID=B8MER3_TALSN|nr:uncharacterized protein TSTA_020050 [Talaromyces stipitatus ATCC 10500]EED16946.1 hypothetical protein TSTA_020050 [Talaromyces stipitatus ATCC 10500]